MGERVYRSIHHAVAAMRRYQERRGSPRGIRFEAVGASAGMDPDADALTVLVVFCRVNGRRALSRLLIERVKMRDVRSREERRRLRHARERFARELCCRGLLEWQGERKAPHDKCRKLRAGTCPRFSAEKT